MKRTICALVAVALGSLIAPRTALAVDGQIAITQARAMAGGVTPGDAPGFPVSINLPGSYVLSSGLTVPDANTTAIEINADHVTVDLNGFAILGPTDCSGGTDPVCERGFRLRRLDSCRSLQHHCPWRHDPRHGTRWRFSPRGFAPRRVFASSQQWQQRRDGDQQRRYGGSVVQHNTVQRNGAYGIALGRGVVADNTVNANGFFGISLDVGIVRNNFVNRNNMRHDFCFDVLYIGNVMFENQDNQVIGGHNGGQNLCGSAACPNAVF